MRLLNTETLELCGPFIPEQVPDYAILSHRWNSEEVTFSDISDAPISDCASRTRDKNGFEKIRGACQLAFNDGYSWIWIDSCCIDKSSSSELQEAINSMWRYYAESNVCYVYLADVPDIKAGWGEAFDRSEWFTRGWTLQELIAPLHVEFYTRNWAEIGTKYDRSTEISKITAIDPYALNRQREIHQFSVAEKLSWAAHRQVTRGEDEAYSLLGLFDINMPLLYGEGREKAFIRLQKSIYSSTADQSIFLFHHDKRQDRYPLLADSPLRFCDRKSCESCVARDTGVQQPLSHYNQIILAALSYTQAHEQIMTTVTMDRNEMSTVLPLLPFSEIMDQLQVANRSSLVGQVTHVAVLNRTTESYDDGALCLLLERWGETGTYLRLDDRPAVLPYIGHLAYRFRPTKVVISSKPNTTVNRHFFDSEFFLEKGLFIVYKWDCNHGDEQRTLIQHPDMGLGLKILGKRGIRALTQVTCQVSSRFNPKLLLKVRLVQRRRLWSIAEVLQLHCADVEMQARPLFHSLAPTDRCSIQLPEGRSLVKLRRSPALARPSARHQVGLQRYQLSIEYEKGSNS